MTLELTTRAEFSICSRPGRYLISPTSSKSVPELAWINFLSSSGIFTSISVLQQGPSPDYFFNPSMSVFLHMLSSLPVNLFRSEPVVSPSSNSLLASVSVQLPSFKYLFVVAYFYFSGINMFLSVDRHLIWQNKIILNINNYSWKKSFLSHNLSKTMKKHNFTFPTMYLGRVLFKISFQVLVTLDGVVISFSYLSFDTSFTENNQPALLIITNQLYR